MPIVKASPSRRGESDSFSTGYSEYAQVNPERIR